MKLIPKLRKACNSVLAHYHCCQFCGINDDRVKRIRGESGYFPIYYHDVCIEEVLKNPHRYTGRTVNAASLVSAWLTEESRWKEEYERLEEAYVVEKGKLAKLYLSSIS